MRASTLPLLAGIGLALAACEGPAGKSADTAAATGPASPAPSPSPSPAMGVIPLNTPPANPHLLSGWSPPEASGVWTTASRAVLRLQNVDAPPGGALKVSLEALAYLPKPKTFQRAYVSVGGERIAELKLVSVGYQPVALSVPARVIRPGQPLDLTFDLPDAVAPSTVSPASPDKRLLGMGLKSVTLAN